MRSTAHILTFMVIVAVAPVATAGILHVPGDQPTIQDGVLAASPGDPVSDHVLYLPLLGEAALTVTPPMSGPLRCGRTVTLDVLYTPPLVDPPGLRGYEVTFTATPQVTWSLGDVTDSGVFESIAGGSAGHFFRVDENGDGSLTVTDALLGPTDGLTTEAPLFNVTFHTAATGTAMVSLPSIKLRDLDNQDITATIAGATIEVDCTPPGRVSSIHAEPGFEKVVLTWQDPPADVATVEIWRAVWHDGSYMSVYPEYDDHPLNTIPTRPANRAQAVVSPEWSLAAIRPAGAQLFVDLSLPTVRGVYYYECFAFDAAGNVGPPALANDRATNYWLGDLFPPPRGDGWIDVADMTVLGAAFWSDPWDFEYNAECDVGPTDDGTGTGIPLTDDAIDFEDLMVFSLNYNAVEPYKNPAPVGGSPILTWGRADETTWALGLAAPCPALKGLHLRAGLPEGIAAVVSEGDLLRSQAGPVFLRSRQQDGLELVVALLGREGGLEGSGELLRVSLSRPAVPGTPTIEARDSGNRELVCELREGSPPAAPVRFRLDQNSPNPFNPSTTIAFSLPEVQRVRLTIYALDGRRVAGLLDERRGPGWHSLTWNGRDDRGRAVASGTYFYRLEAGPHGETRKMILTK
jgi:hypothetical protein